MPRAMMAQPRQRPTKAQLMLMAQSTPMPRATAQPTSKRMLMAQPTPNTKAQHELAHTLRPRAHEMPRLATMPALRPMAQLSTPEPPRPRSDDEPGAEPGAEHLSAESSAEQSRADLVVEPSGAELSIELRRALSR